MSKRTYTVSDKVKAAHSKRTGRPRATPEQVASRDTKIQALLGMMIVELIVPCYAVALSNKHAYNPEFDKHQVCLSMKHVKLAYGTEAPKVFKFFFTQKKRGGLDQHNMGFPSRWELKENPSGYQAMLPLDLLKNVKANPALFESAQWPPLAFVNRLPLEEQNKYVENASYKATYISESTVNNPRVRTNTCGGKRAGSGRPKRVFDEVAFTKECLFPAFCQAFRADPGLYKDRYLQVELSKTEIAQAYGPEGLKVWMAVFQLRKIGGCDRFGVGYKTQWVLCLGQYTMAKTIIEHFGHNIKSVPDKPFPSAEMQARVQAVRNRKAALAAKRANRQR